MKAATRKSVAALTLADLETCPIWEYALDEESLPGQDETTVRPCVGRTRASGVGELVRTRFIAANGRLMFGFAVAGGSRDPGVAHPVIVLASGQHIGFWFGALHASREVPAAYAVLEMHSRELFPLVYRADVPVAGPPLFGELSAFLGLASDLRTVVEYR